MVLPELPQSSGAGRGAQAAQAASVDGDERRFVRGRRAGVRETIAPRAPTQASVEAQSAPGA